MNDFSFLQNNLFYIDKKELINKFIINVLVAEKECDLCCENTFTIVTLNCDHVICVGCICKIIYNIGNNKCPYCRNNIFIFDKYQNTELEKVLQNTKNEMIQNELSEFLTGLYNEPNRNIFTFQTPYVRFYIRTQHIEHTRDVVTITNVLTENQFEPTDRYINFVYDRFYGDFAQSSNFTNNEKRLLNKFGFSNDYKINEYFDHLNNYARLRLIKAWRVFCTFKILISSVNFCHFNLNTRIMFRNTKIKFNKKFKYNKNYINKNKFVIQTVPCSLEVLKEFLVYENNLVL